MLLQLRNSPEPERRAVEFEEALAELNTGVDRYPRTSRPYAKQRGNWETHYRRLADRFSEDPDDNKEMKHIVDALEEKVGRNDPCPCGKINPATGKCYKYKKCGLIGAPHHGSVIAHPDLR